MPFLLLFAFVPAILVIALAVMLISGCIMFLTNRNSLTAENISRVGFSEMFNKISQQLKKKKTVQTIDIIILKEK